MVERMERMEKRMDEERNRFKKEIDRLEKREKERYDRKSKESSKESSIEKSNRKGMLVKSPSDTTLYTPALKKCTDPSQANYNLVNQITNFVDKIRIETERAESGRRRRSETVTTPRNDKKRREEDERDEPVPGTSRSGGKSSQAEQLIIEAEQFKAAVEAPEGTFRPNNAFKNNVNINTGREMKEVSHDLAVSDNDFFYLTCHIDKGLRSKIENGEFVDLEKLLPQDRLQRKTSEKLSLFHKDGETFFANDDSNKRINGIRKWEQAFRVYAIIYCRAKPDRSGEIWQYMS